MPKSQTQTKARPDLSNATVPFLVDEVAQIRRKISDLEDDKLFFEAALKARLEPEQDKAEGELFKMERADRTQTRLNTDAVKELLSKLENSLTELDRLEESCQDDPGIVEVLSEIKQMFPDRKQLSSCYSSSSFQVMTFNPKTK